MNEIIFFSHFFLFALFVLAAQRIGKLGLYTLVMMSIILSNLFVLKEVSLFGLTVTAVEPYTIATMISLGMLQEFYSDKDATDGLKVMLFALSFLLVMSFIHTSYIPAPVDQYHQHYAPLLASSPRILLTSIFVALSMQYLNITLLKISKNNFAHIPYVVRQTGILLFVQLLDTICFSYCALYGIMHNLTHIIMMSYAIKVITIGVTSPILGLVKKMNVQSTT